MFAILPHEYVSDTFAVPAKIVLDRGTVRICDALSAHGRCFVLWHNSGFCVGWDGEWCRAGEYARFLTKADARSFAEAHGWHVYEPPAKPLEDESPYARED